MDLTHLNNKGEAHMVDVGAKDITQREAVAEASVRMLPQTLAAITTGETAKGDVFATARIAGIMAAKQTANIIPLCHTIPIDGVEVDIQPVQPDCVHITVTARTSYKTGIEMEALTAASTAALTVYDMCKAIDRGMTIENIRLISKSGGKSGAFIRED